MTTRARAGRIGLLPLVLVAISLGANHPPASRQAAPAAVSPGKQVYDRWCLACHGSGVGNPGTIALAAKYNSKVPALLEQRSDLTPEAITYYVRHGVSVMPSFRKTEITDKELAALNDYLGRKMKK